MDKSCLNVTYLLAFSKIESVCAILKEHAQGLKFFCQGISVWDRDDFAKNFAKTKCHSGFSLFCVVINVVA